MKMGKGKSVESLLEVEIDGWIEKTTGMREEMEDALRELWNEVEVTERLSKNVRDLTNSVLREYEKVSKLMGELSLQKKATEEARAWAIRMKRERDEEKRDINQQVDEFNAGYDAFQAGVACINEPFGLVTDQWEIGYAWAHWYCGVPGFTAQEVIEELTRKNKGLRGERDEARAWAIRMKRERDDARDFIDSLNLVDNLFPLARTDGEV